MRGCGRAGKERVSRRGQGGSERTTRERDAPVDLVLERTLARARLRQDADDPALLDPLALGLALGFAEEPALLLELALEPLGVVLPPRLKVDEICLELGELRRRVREVGARGREGRLGRGEERFEARDLVVDGKVEPACVVRVSVEGM